MNSLRMKITLLTVSAIIIAIAATIIVGVVAIKNIGSKNSEQVLFLMCQTGQENLDAYFESVEDSVKDVSSFIKADLDMTEPEDFEKHIDRARSYFEKKAYKTNGVFTYYYRIDPEYSDTEKGFWYIDIDGNGFVEHEVTDISLYDTTNTSALVWFTVPKNEGKAIWQSPYVTENLDKLVLSYNMPIYRKGVFVGVVGIEIDYTTMKNQVDNINLYNGSGYAFVLDENGNIAYHPKEDKDDPENMQVPEELLTKEHIDLVRFTKYRYNGVDKQASVKDLHNGMRLVVTVPVSVINGNWQNAIYVIIIISAAQLVVFIVLALRLTGHITRPLRDLTDAAEQLDKGNYDVKLDYKGNDEVGILTRTVNRLIRHLKGYISDLNSLAYGDALTSVRNKGAFDVHVREIQARIDDPAEHPEFAIGIFDCDNLKDINDRFGHDKGDMYIKNSSHLICRVFQYSPVFRIGGDEFAVILQNRDYKNREELEKYYTEKSAEIGAFAEGPWEKVSVAIGIAVYDPNTDSSVEDVIRRADQLMYENKRERKAGRDIT